MNKKGFTLIELLAVIIILGILMIIAIPSVTKYISDSRKNAYIDSAKQLIGSARNIVNSGEFEMYDTNTTYYIDVACIKSENVTKSPYGEFVENGAFVVVTYDGQGYSYYWTSVDDAGQGIKDIIRFDKLDTDDISSDLSPSDITTTRGIDGRGNTIVIRMNNGTGSCTKDGSNPATNQVSGETGDKIVGKICRRATTLHTATCSKTSDGCYAVGYYVGGSKNTTTITYGSLGTQGGALVSGDALDCDVNGDGIYDSTTERFYYVSSAFDVNSNSFDNTKAVLLYYANISNDGTNITAPVQTCYPYHTSGKNFYGPGSIAAYLPTTTQWNNDQIITPAPNRQIKNEVGGTTTRGGTIPQYTYGKAARLLTTQELVEGCSSVSAIGNFRTGELNGCPYIMENLGQFTSSGAWGYWLENPYSSDEQSCSVMFVDSNYRRINGRGAAAIEYITGARPAIEVLKSNIEN